MLAGSPVTRLPADVRRDRAAERRHPARTERLAPDREQVGEPQIGAVELDDAGGIERADLGPAARADDPVMLARERRREPDAGRDDDGLPAPEQLDVRAEAALDRARRALGGHACARVKLRAAADRGRDQAVLGGERRVDGRLRRARGRAAAAGDDHHHHHGVESPPHDAALTGLSVRLGSHTGRTGSNEGVVHAGQQAQCVGLVADRNDLAPIAALGTALAQDAARGRPRHPGEDDPGDGRPREADLATRPARPPPPRPRRATPTRPTWRRPPRPPPTPPTCATRTENADQGAGVAGRRQRRHRAPRPPTPTLPRRRPEPGRRRDQERQHRVGLQLARPARTGHQPELANGNYAGATFIHYENLGYDFMFGDGTGGLSIWSLKDPAKPQYVSRRHRRRSSRQPADAHGAGRHPTARFYEGENPTVDSRRKLAFLARDPRSFGNNGHPGGRTGLYIIDVKDPWNPADPHLPLGARRPHRDLHQRLPLPVERRPGQQRLARRQRAAGHARLPRPAASPRVAGSSATRSGPASRRS